MHGPLSRVERVFERGGGEEHVYQHVEEGGWGLAAGVPVYGPFVEDADDEVAEDGEEEDHGGDKVGVDVQC